MLNRHVGITALSFALFSAPLVHAQTSSFPAQPITPELVQKTTITADGALRKELAYGIYQLTYSPEDKALYVASAEMADGVRGGVIYKLDPQSLDVKGVIHSDERNFGLTTNTDGDVLFVTNSLTPGVSRVELGNKGTTQRIRFSNVGTDGFNVGPRSIRHDPVNHRVYVGGVGNPAVIWVLNDADLTLQHTIENAGKWVTGLWLDTDNQRLYAANGDGEILVIDTQNDQITQRWKPAGIDPALLLNIAVDKKRNLLYVTESQHQKTVYVLNASTGQLVKQLAVGDALDVLFNPERDELYLSHRAQGKVSVLDAGTHAVKAEYTLAEHPNSLLLGPGNQLYVTVKSPFTAGHKISARESVVRIDLNAVAQ